MPLRDHILDVLDISTEAITALGLTAARLLGRARPPMITPVRAGCSLTGVTGPTYGFRGT